MKGPGLVVEDDDAAREALVAFLEAEGERVATLGLEDYMTKPIQFPRLLQFVAATAETP